MTVAILIVMVMMAMLIPTMPPVFGKKVPYQVCETHHNNNYKQNNIHALIIRLYKKTAAQKQ